MSVLAILWWGTTGCGGNLKPRELYGLWSNVDEGTVRVLEFAEEGSDDDLSGETDVYWIFAYPEGSDAEEVQRGTFSIVEAGEDWTLVTEVTATPDGSFVGEEYRNVITEASKDVLALELNDGGERVYAATDSMP